MNREVQTEGSCPFRGTRVEGGHGDGPTLEDWWPERLRVELLHANAEVSNPLGPDFDYAKAFESIDLDALKKDIFEVLESSKSWWPADYGHYGPQMVRTSWHSAGTYRIADGRGGAGTAMQRFLPISSWIDNANVDKSRRLLWPIKRKYGSALSWADLIALTGNCALESMGLPIVGFGGGRVDAWEPDAATYWGPENEMQGRERWNGSHDEANYDLENPVAASEMSLIYVNPEGPGGEPDPLGSAREIRETFARMGMNDEETVALVAGGHAFGKSHGAVSPDHMGPGPEGGRDGAPGLRLDQLGRLRQRRVHHQQRHRGRLDVHAADVEQRVLRQPVRLRVGALREPRRRQAVAPEPTARRPPTRCRTPTSRASATRR